MIDKLLADILPAGERVLIFSVSPSPSLARREADDATTTAMDRVHYRTSPSPCTSNSCILPDIRMLDLLEDFMALRSIPYARLDGSTRRPRRTLDIKLVRVLTALKRTLLTRG